MAAPEPSPRRHTSWSGHAWTIAPALRHWLLRTAAPTAAAWSTTVEDPRLGPVRLTGALRVPPGATTLALLVHGLGGEPDSFYVRHAARELGRRGIASLALALRGADRRGEDVYHAGLVEDLAAAVASPALRGFAAIHCVGFSLGGHVALRWALAPGDPRVRSVTAVCAPVHLRSAQQCLDAPGGAFYRRYVLAGLKEIHAAVAARREVAHVHAVVRRCRTFRDWDELVVVPRFGFRGADDYYETMSVAPHLGALAVSSLLVLAEGDPLVPPAVVAPFLPGRAAGLLDVRWTARGGHLGFPGDLDLGFGRDRGLVGQIAGFWAGVG